MLPFLPSKKIVTALASSKGKNDLEVKPEVTTDSLAEAARDVMRAIEEKSADSLAKAIRAAFQILESEDTQEETIDE